ncbi:winged helix-turn-helix domain-containing protein [Hafnia paralvei]|uniref:winged helix-turn-helix domain-containing protein n=1 Tax=Hafnia paralvei TaxID=546367 RepID=UPI0018F07CE9|nr:winged helix-turn-helix domain-containing protein [Hafnia paralvei]MBW2956194.1 winged helix-turn-helix domain-containing protein [Hafnia paralvei]MBW2956944.1 winged helix-turn-helix domain-containing protein [Hafnia paralvei]MCQ4171354.1 winged helix-turn-helix domain-containing protein [Hafnia paralvei]
MKYKINNTIEFDDKTGILSNTESGSIITLSTTAIRIFAYMLKNPNNIISREDFFENVWDIYGQEASNNSLNQYLSLIRKAFRNIDISYEIIHTEPRKCFYLKADVEYIEDDFSSSPHGEQIGIAEQKNKLEKNIIIEEAQQSDESLSKKMLPVEFGTIVNNSQVKQNIIRKRNKTIFLIFLALAFSGTGFFISQFWPSSSKDIPTVTLYKLGVIDSCPVFTLYESSNEMADHKINIARELITEHSLPCLINTIYIFQPDDFLVYTKKGRVLLSRCTTVNHEKKRKFAGCKDIYIYEK